MALFQKDSELRAFQNQFCKLCRHHPTNPEQPKCPIIATHIEYQFDGWEIEQLLSEFIPGDGMYEQCTMFISVEPDRCQYTKEMFSDT